MLKALVYLMAPLASAGLVLAFGLPVLVACAALALGTLVLSQGEIAESTGRWFDNDVRRP